MRKAAFLILVLGTIVLAKTVDDPWPIVPGLDLSQQPSPSGPDGQQGQYPGGINLDGWPVNVVNPDIPYPSRPYIASAACSGTYDGVHYSIDVVIKVIGAPDTTYCLAACVWDMGNYTSDSGDNYSFSVATDDTRVGRTILQWSPVIVPTSTPKGWYVMFWLYDTDGTCLEALGIACYLH